MVIIASRRDLADIIVRHIESQMSVKLNRPDASAATPLTLAPFDRMVEKLYPIPPPCCIVGTASRNAAKTLDIESEIVPITKLLKKVPCHPFQALAIIRLAGKIENLPIQHKIPTLTLLHLSHNLPVRTRSGAGSPQLLYE